MNDRISRIHLACSPLSRNGPESFPAAVLFDSLDADVAVTETKKQELLYYEYALLRFDGDAETKGVRKAETRIRPMENPSPPEVETGKGIPDSKKEYDLEAVRVRDHVMIRITDGILVRETILALPDNTRFAYLAFTGQNCLIRDIRIEEDETAVPKDYIPRIADEISFIEGCPEGDLPNFQIEGWRLASSEGIPVSGRIRITLRTKSLPSARLIWHCPFICLFSSDDRKVEGNNYREFALIRMDGENWHTDDQVTNETEVLLTNAFPGWDEWKKRLKSGIDCEIILWRENDAVILQTENLGIRIQSRITVRGFGGDICAALTGDQCAITDIHITG